MCRSIRSLFVTVFTLASLLVAAPALAVDILVTTGLDSLDEDGSCSLREAVIAANTDAAVDSCAAGSGADRVLVSRGGFYPLTITGAGENASMTGDLDVVGDLQIVAVGPSSGRARIWQEDEDRALHVVRLESATSRLKLVNISLTDAYLSAEVPYSRCGIETDGGCVYVDPASEIEMVNSRVNSGRATERGGNVFIGEGGTALFTDTHVLLGVAEADGTRIGQGGGIFMDSEAQVEMYRGKVAFNTAGLGGWGEGGGLYLSGDSQLYAEGTHIQGNQSGIETRGIGGGFHLASDAYAELERVEVLENHATRHGGGAYVEEGATIKSNYMNVLGNIAAGESVNYGGGIYSLGDVHVARSDISENQAGVEESNGRGAGVYNLGLFTADESLIANNWASRHGGGVVSVGVTNLITSTLSGNVAYLGNGGGYWSMHQTPEYEDVCDPDAGDVFIQVTVAENEAGVGGPGLHFQGGADACLINSVMADGCNFIGSTAVAYGVGQNAETVSGGCGLGGLLLTVTEMDLSPLGDHGGATWTHLPGSGSLLIDQADNAFCPPVDQRWAFRPTHLLGVPGDVCDLGAVEADGRWLEAAMGSTCGLGFEFALVLPVLAWWQRRRIRA